MEHKRFTDQDIGISGVVPDGWVQVAFRIRAFQVHRDDVIVDEWIGHLEYRYQ
jgi:hypothetical protein